MTQVTKATGFNENKDQVRTEIRRIVVAGTVHAHGGEEVDDAQGQAAIDALALGQQVKTVEFFKEASTRLMNRADDGTATLRQLLQ